MEAPNVSVVRAWLVTIFGAVLIVYGLVEVAPASVMLGFSVLGAEPIYRGAT